MSEVAEVPNVESDEPQYNVSVPDLLAKIGAQTIEMDMMRGEIGSLRAQLEEASKPKPNRAARRAAPKKKPR